MPRLTIAPAEPPRQHNSCAIVNLPFAPACPRSRSRIGRSLQIERLSQSCTELLPLRTADRAVRSVLPKIVFDRPGDGLFSVSFLSYALSFVKTELCMAIDADTEVAADGVEKLIAALAEPSVAAASGFVLPRHVTSVWERGRYIEYLFAFTFFKPVQDFFERPLISSGCFSAYRTSVLKSLGGWSNRTMAEDMDLTW